MQASSVKYSAVAINYIKLPLIKIFNIFFFATRLAIRLNLAMHDMQY